MAPHVGLPLREWLGERTAVWAELILSTPMVLLAGWPFFLRGWKSLVNRRPNMFTLLALGTGGAYGFSLAATIAPQLFPPGFPDPPGNVGIYQEAAAVIVGLVLLRE